MRDRVFETEPVVRLLETPLMPARAMCVGVTGHRLERLGTIDTVALENALRAIFRSVEAAASATGPCRLRLISGLAEGADTFAVDVATGCGWAHDAVLPFPRAVFAGDFDIGNARTAFKRRLAQAQAVLELPGERTVADGSGTAYERVGRMILAQCDLLIGIWDGAAARGRGGAAQIIAEAVLLGIPVIQIDPKYPEEPVLLWDGLDHHDLGQHTIDTVARGTLEALPALIDQLLVPPHGAGERAMLNAFQQGTAKRAMLSRAYGGMLCALCVIAKRSKKPAYQTLDGGGISNPALDLRFRQADQQATHLSRLFRSGYVTNFTFAAAAVLLSLLGLILPVAVKPILIVTELLLIGIILTLTTMGNRQAWHQRWLGNRQLAERLRCLRLSALLGDLDLHGETALINDWVSWLTRATAREIGLHSVIVDHAYLTMVRAQLQALLGEQIGYLGHEVALMSKLEHRLHQLGTVLFGGTAFVCVFFLVADAASRAITGEGIAESAHGLVVLSTIATAAFPAIGAAIYGIRMQGDFAGIADRGKTLLSQLSTLETVVKEDALDYDTLLWRVRRTKELMTADLSSWTHAYRARPLTLPG